MLADRTLLETHSVATGHPIKCAHVECQFVAKFICFEQLKEWRDGFSIHESCEMEKIAQTENSQFGIRGARRRINLQLSDLLDNIEWNEKFNFFQNRSFERFTIRIHSSVSMPMTTVVLNYL